MFSTAINTGYNTRDYNSFDVVLNFKIIQHLAKFTNFRHLIILIRFQEFSEMLAYTYITVQI